MIKFVLIENVIIMGNIDVFFGGKYERKFVILIRVYVIKSGS